MEDYRLHGDLIPPEKRSECKGVGSLNLLTYNQMGSVLARELRGFLSFAYSPRSLLILKIKHVIKIHSIFIFSLDLQGFLIKFEIGSWLEKNNRLCEQGAVRNLYLLTLVPMNRKIFLFCFKVYHQKYTFPKFKKSRFEIDDFTSLQSRTILP